MRRIRIHTARTTLDTVWLARLLLLLALAIAIPAMGLDQRLTGPAVNALLIISVVTSGLPGALGVAATPSLVALARGVLPLPMAAMVPYIVLGNVALVSAFALLRGRNYWVALAVASGVKVAVLYGAVTYLVSVPPSLAVMMQWPQLYTALLGGVVAWTLLGLHGLWRKRGP
jgi:hypothetical protein